MFSLSVFALFSTGFKLLVSILLFGLTFILILYNSLPSDEIVNTESPSAFPVNTIFLEFSTNAIEATFAFVILKLSSLFL